MVQTFWMPMVKMSAHWRGRFQKVRHELNFCLKRKTEDDLFWKVLDFWKPKKSIPNKHNSAGSNGLFFFLLLLLKQNTYGWALYEGKRFTELVVLEAESPNRITASLERVLGSCMASWWMRTARTDTRRGGYVRDRKLGRDARVRAHSPLTARSWRD